MSLARTGGAYPVRIPATTAARKGRVRELRARIRAKQAAIERAQKRIEAMHVEAELLEATDLVVDGVPISVDAVRHTETGRVTCLNYRSPLPGNLRYAKVYMNAHNETTWGLSLSHIERGDQWLGAHHKSRKPLEAAAVQWVAKGIKAELK